MPEWHHADVDLRQLLQHAAQTTAELFRERGAAVVLAAPTCRCCAPTPTGCCRCC